MATVEGTTPHGQSTSVDVALGQLLVCIVSIVKRIIFFQRHALNLSIVLAMIFQVRYIAFLRHMHSGQASMKDTSTRPTAGSTSTTATVTATTTAAPKSCEWKWVNHVSVHWLTCSSMVSIARSSFMFGHQLLIVYMHLCLHGD